MKSPRSLKACKLQGIDPSELLQKSYNEIQEIFKGKKFDKETLELQFKHYEDKRKEKIKVLLEERAEIIKNEEYEKLKSKNSYNNVKYFLFL